MSILKYPYQSHFVETPGLKIHYLKEGSGPPLILLHGWPQTAYMWRHQIEYLKKSFTVYAPDNRGFGLTEKPKIRITRDLLARDVVAFMDALGLQKAHLAGHDWGGMIAFKLAIDFPSRCESLALIDTSTTVWPRWAGHAYWAKQSDLPLQFFEQCGEEFIRWCLHGERAVFSGVDSPFPRQPLPADYAWCDEEALQHFMSAISQPGTGYASVDYYRSGLPFHRIQKNNDDVFEFEYIGEQGAIDIWKHEQGFWAHPDAQQDMCFAPEDWHKQFSGPSLFLFTPLLVPQAFDNNSYRKDFVLGNNLWERAFTGALPDLKYSGIASGHFLPEEKPSSVNTALFEFFT
ncbi:MAG: alpha/beta hydrolase [Pseudomonadales bacterium]|nr:alpha/beta hydrolase [Pseudomonadales bacterium]